MNHPDVKRNIEETLRLVKSYQFTESKDKYIKHHGKESDIIVPKPKEN
jgi:alkyl hydroperoxide reductase subunit AhpC